MSVLQLSSSPTKVAAWREHGPRYRCLVGVRESPIAMDPLKVFISNRDSTCNECREDLGRHAWIFLNRERGALCLSCADLDHLIYLPSGDAALTRRATKYSDLTAVVLKWSRARNRYERQGILVATVALERAEQECLADQDVRARRQAREAEKRAELDAEYVHSFAERIRALFPHCPPERERVIAEHACMKYSGRVGRSAEARSFDEDSVRLAIIAHIRHDARVEVEGQVRTVQARWEQGE
jgi:hypothetical protein